MTEVLFFALLLSVMFSTRKNKRYGRDSMAFEMNWPPLLVRLMRELMQRNIPHSPQLHLPRFYTQVA